MERSGRQPRATNWSNFAETAEQPRTGLHRWTYDIGFANSKDTLKLGRVDEGTHRVSVAAHDRTEARLMADQMVASTGREPTSAKYVSHEPLPHTPDNMENKGSRAEQY